MQGGAGEERWIQEPADVPLTSCVSKGKALLCMPQLPHLLNGTDQPVSASLMLRHALRTVSSSQEVSGLQVSFTPWGQGLDLSLGNQRGDIR